jgi:hypothetical protein
VIRNFKTSGFRCPPVVPPDALDEFCIPEECCPDRLETFKFPSPNSCLPEEVLEALELRIEAANEFLLDLALSNKRDKNEVFQNAFEKLLGREVKVFLECPIIEQAAVKCGADQGNEEEKAAETKAEEEREMEQIEENAVTGFVHLAGKDFSILKNNGTFILIPHQQICEIELQNRFAVPLVPPSLNNIDPCLRRCLTFRFGEVVASSPTFIQIFFGLDLRVFLHLFIDKEIKLILENGTIEGKIFDVDGETLIICENDNNKMIPLEDICIIVIKED